MNHSSNVSALCGRFVPFPLQHETINIISSNYAIHLVSNISFYHASAQPRDFEKGELRSEGAVSQHTAHKKITDLIGELFCANQPSFHGKIGVGGGLAT